MQIKYETIASNDSTKIFYVSIMPEKPKAIVVISHGYGGHSGQYQHFIDTLCQNNYGVYALDHRGHGRSQTERGHLEAFEDFVEDFALLINHINYVHAKLPIYTLGHSMGGLITFLYGINYPDILKGQIFSAPALGMPWGTSLIPEWFFKLSKKCFPLAKVHHIIKRPASRDLDFLAQYRKDPYTLKYATAGFFCEFIAHGIKSAQLMAPNYHLPCLFLHGREDKIIPYQHTIDIFNTIRSKEKTLKLYDQLYHELLHEPEKETVIEDILIWLKQQESPSNS